MRTIVPISDEDLKWLKAEPQLEFTYLKDGLPICVMMPERIVRRINIDYITGCWKVSGHGSGNGYAKLMVGGKNRSAHRVVYTLLVGPIPHRHVLDHKKSVGCSYRSCCCPDHLEPVSDETNTSRGRGKLFQFKRKRDRGNRSAEA